MVQGELRFLGLDVGETVITHYEDIGGDIAAEGAARAGSGINACFHGGVLSVSFIDGLPVFAEKLEIGLGMCADGADLGGLGTHMDMAAVAADPYGLLPGLKTGDSDLRN